MASQPARLGTARSEASRLISSGNNGLYVIHADGSGLTEILGGNDFKREPVWVTG